MLASLSASLAALLLAAPPSTPPSTRVPADPPPQVAEIVSIRDLTVAGPRGVEPSPRARALAGAEVRLVGFMAETEEPSVGEFWLAARPVECDEGGGGTGDLPPDAVRVVLAANPGEQVPHLAGLLAVTGVLHLGGEPASDGPPSAFRLVVAQPATLAAAP